MHFIALKNQVTGFCLAMSPPAWFTRTTIRSHLDPSRGCKSDDQLLVR